MRAINNKKELRKHVATKDRYKVIRTAGAVRLVDLDDVRGDIYTLQGVSQYYSKASERLRNGALVKGEKVMKILSA